MKEIYREGIQSKEQGKLTYYIYEEPRVIADRLSRIPCLHEMMIGL